MKSLLSLCLLLILSISAFAQDPFQLPQKPGKSETKTSTTSNNKTKQTSKQKAQHTDKQKNNGQKTSAAHVNAASTTSKSAVTGNAGNPVGPGGVGGGGGKGTASTLTTSKTQSTSDASGLANANGQNSAATPLASPHVSSGSSGLSSSAKIGIGVGVGIGVVAIASAAGLILFLRRRRRSPYGSDQSATDLRNRPAMSSGAPALAGVSEMGRSLSKHSLPRTPSQHSLVSMQNPYLGPVIDRVEPSQPSIARAPTYHSMRPEPESLMPAPPPYEEAPSPLEERNPEPVSPMSPVSPVESRPPSPLHDFER